MAERGRPIVDLAASGRASGAVQIQDLRLRSSYFQADRGDLTIEGFHTEYFAEVLDLGSAILRIGVGFRLADHREGHDSPPSGQDDIEGDDAADLMAFADYEILYDVNGEISPEDAESFAWINGVMNAWSYWRALVQSTLLAMGLPKLVLPVFRVPVEAMPGSQASPPAASSTPRARRSSVSADGHEVPAELLSKAANARPTKAPAKRATKGVRGTSAIAQSKG